MLWSKFLLIACLITLGVPKPQVPTYMLHLLEEAIPPADIVRSLVPTNIVLNDEREKQIQYLEFDIPESSLNEHLEEAQLRIYATVHHQHTALYGVERLLQITLRSPDNSYNNIEATPTTLSHIYLKNNSWFTINITNSFKTWLKIQENKLFLYLHVLNPYTSVGGAGKLDLLNHLTDTLLLLMYNLNEPPLRPVNVIKHNISRRSVQELEDYEEESNNVWDDDKTLQIEKQQQQQQVTATNALIISGGKITTTKKKPHRNLCRRKPLYVNFAEIEYDTWIVAPAGYEAFQCSGKCFYPVSEHLTPSKHAIVQTLLHTVSPRKVPRACCVPTRLLPISVLYVDEHGVLTYRFSYEDMVVAECGCR